MAWVNAQVARCLNALYDRWECFWTRRPYSRQVLEDADAVLDKLVYTITNAVSSKLVTRPEDWPGLVSLPGDIGERLEAERPAWYFKGEGGGIPDSAADILTVPPAFAHLGVEEFRELLRERVEARVRELEEERAAKKEEVLGAKRVLKQEITEAPSREEPHRRLNPRVACKDRARRKSLLAALKAFYKSYRRAFEDFRAGDRKVLFPAGTFWMRVYCGVFCEAFAPT
jgi:hypothetical protein